MVKYSLIMEYLKKDNNYSQIVCCVVAQEQLFGKS